MKLPDVSRNYDAEARAILAECADENHSQPTGGDFDPDNLNPELVAIGLARIDLGRAWRILAQAFTHQAGDGMASCGFGVGPDRLVLPRIPVAAIAARVLHERSDGDGFAARHMRSLFPKIFAAQRWWHDTRDADGDGLVAIHHPAESGREAAPEWDGARGRMSSFRMVDVGLQSLLMRADRDLFAMAQALGLKKEADQLRGWILKSTAAMPGLKGADGLYRARDLTTGRSVEVLTAAAYLPMVARSASLEDSRVMHGFLQACRAEGRLGGTTVDPDDASHAADKPWRGAVHPLMSRLMADGFASYGFRAEAIALREETRDLIEANGFAGCFEACAGKRLAEGKSVETAAVWLSWCGAEEVIDLMTPA